MKYPCTSTVFFFRQANEGGISLLATDLKAAMPLPRDNAPQPMGPFLRSIGGAASYGVEIHYIRVADDHLQLDIEAEGQPPMDAYAAIAEHYQLGWVADGIEPKQQLYVNTDVSGRFLPFRYIVEFYGELPTAGPYKHLRGSGDTGAILFRTEAEVLDAFRRCGLLADSIKSLESLLDRELATIYTFDTSLKSVG